MMTETSCAIPPHRAILVPGLHAYASSLSVFAGEEIAFHVSSTVPYEFSLRQLGPDVDDAGSDPVLHTLPGQPPVPQPIHPGSYVAVDNALPHEDLLEFSLECWVKLWEFGDVQTVLSQSDGPLDPGFALRIDAIGRPVFACGEATLVAPALSSRRWVHLAATFARGE